MICDLHTHSAFSPDAKDTAQAMILKAIDMGIQYYAITDHCDCNFWEMPPSPDVRDADMYGSRYYAKASISRLDDMKKIYGIGGIPGEDTRSKGVNPEWGAAVTFIIGILKDEPEKKGKLGELRKEDISILADERANAIVVMAAPGDVETIKGVIRSMDIQLSQVVIEAVIVSLSFSDTQETGMSWIQKTMLTMTGKNSTPRFAYATSGGGLNESPLDVTSATIPSSTGVSGWFSIFDLNMDLVLKAVQTDSRAKVMESPRITTMDNKEAKLESTERIYWKEGSTHYTSSDYYSDNIKNEDIGIKLSVTPRINKKGYITLTIEEEQEGNMGYRDVLGTGTSYPQLYTRKMGADVAVQSGETVVLGGLAQNQVNRTRTKVPILGSIPLLGWLFRYDKEETVRNEVIVFLTPSVIDNPAAMEDDARKLKASIDTDGVWDSSWSSSRLADPLKPKQARKVLENGEDTVVPPRYPLTGYLTGLNDEKLVNVVPAISNAVEAVEKLEDPEKKIIDIVSERRGDMVSIHISNYFDGKLRLEDGMPVTSKTWEEGFHGFGMKSMKLIAEKYGGSLSASADGDLFTLDVYLMNSTPSPEK